MSRIAAMVATLAVLALAPAEASAASDPAGDWIGAMHARKGDLATGLEVRRTAEGYQGSYDDITQGLWGIPVRRPATAASLVLENRSSIGTLTFAWDPAADRWTGTWRDKTGAYSMILRRGAVPPAPVMSRPDAIILGVFAVVMALEAAGIARLAQLRRRKAAHRGRGEAARVTLPAPQDYRAR